MERLNPGSCCMLLAALRSHCPFGDSGWVKACSAGCWASGCEHNAGVDTYNITAPRAACLESHMLHVHAAGQIWALGA